LILESSTEGNDELDALMKPSSTAIHSSYSTLTNFTRKEPTTHRAIRPSAVTNPFNSVLSVLHAMNVIGQVYDDDDDFKAQIENNIRFATQNQSFSSLTPADLLAKGA
jgi:hypothetical protein